MLTIRELIKTLYNAFNQKLKKHRGNWEQNNPTADDYIKNRPFYTDETKKIVNVPEQKITIPSGNPSAQLILPKLIEFVVGQTYEVKWDDKTYPCVAFDMNGIGVIGNQSLFDNGTDTGEPFIMMILKAEGFGIVAAPEAIGTHTVEVTSAKIVKIDKKYLPDDIIPDLAPVATSGNYNDLINQPTIYNDVVRYNVSQSLTASQKTRARANIGAGTSSFSGSYNDLTNKPTIYTDVVRYNTTQSLTTTQKTQARTNIGAGTSSFSGSYNDLSNKPSIPNIDATLSIGGDAADAKATGDAINNITEVINAPRDGVALIDQSNSNVYVMCIRDGNLVTYIAIKDIEITSMPTKTEYTEGEYFDSTGMIVTVTTYDGESKEITDYTLPDGYLIAGVPINVSYVEAGITHTVEVPITVNAFDPAVVLVDFTYTANADGTYYRLERNI